MSNLRAVGCSAEDRAAEFLASSGYTIVARRAHMRRGELDIVAMDGETLVFVEVKSRLAPGNRPDDAVGANKLTALRRAIEIYLSTMEAEPRETRLDLVAIDRNGIRHYKDILAL